MATSVIPIVFPVAADPLGTGLVASLARPGGNVTGLSFQQTDLAGKRIELLRELLPGLRRFGIVANVGAPAAALDALKDRVEALYVVSDPLLTTNRTRVAILAVGARLPTIHGAREHVEAGGLISYGASFPALFRRGAEYVDKILRGAKPADLPIEQPTKFDLVVNLISAKALGLTIPHSLLARADEVIE
jgi:putative tryptophan/tyrosine transport system substrate-binding protein